MVVDRNWVSSAHDIESRIVGCLYSRDHLEFVSCRVRRSRSHWMLLGAGRASNDVIVRYRRHQYQYFKSLCTYHERIRKQMTNGGCNSRSSSKYFNGFYFLVSVLRAKRLSLYTDEWYQWLIRNRCVIKYGRKANSIRSRTKSKL